jgi:tRNA nucleotidyltransferase (CCA-adding enzyme)
MCAAFDTSLELTDREEELLSIFRGTLLFKQRSTVARVAGGWVRDKLLGKYSDDIDVALDDQTGIEFASAVQEYLTSQGQLARRVAVIEANPEKSKHLETATTHVLGMSIDFVNLRAETYSGDSRIPEIRFGSPLEDALRRDFTINALFYNINNGTVEDLTGMGLGDLSNSILRTPLDPFITFKDDPLRVLRAVRFASRFGLAVDASLLAAAQSAEVIAGLAQKVSRERVLKEIEGTLGGSSCRPALALELLKRMGLYSTVFSPVGMPETIASCSVVADPSGPALLHALGTGTGTGTGAETETERGIETGTETGTGTETAESPGGAAPAASMCSR